MPAHDPRLTKRLELVRHGLEREFPSAPAQELAQRFEHIVAQLLAEARVVDFVPVLAHRYTRDWLASGEATAESQAA